MNNTIDDILKTPAIGPSQIIGHSRANRPIHGAVYGSGPQNISLMGGCHADEPVGPRFLRKFSAYLDTLPADHELLSQYTWYLVPHANPDGEAINQQWYKDGDDIFDLIPYLRHAVRELPGDDVEFGFPAGKDQNGLRRENEAIYRFWLRADNGFALHASLHGMMVAAGPWFLIEKEWIDKSALLQKRCRDKTLAMNYRLHDVDRKGEKGFHRISRGFCTRPDSREMKAFFLAKGDTETAAKFYPSSMEAIRDLSRDALTIVSEMPLFILPDLPDTMNWPDDTWNNWMARLQTWKQHLLTKSKEENKIREEITASGLTLMPVDDQMRLQWRFITAGLEQISLNAGNRD